MCRRLGFQRLSEATAGATNLDARAAMLPRSGRVGTIYASAAEVRDRSRPAHVAFYATISLPTPVYTEVGRRGEGVNFMYSFEKTEKTHDYKTKKKEL